METEQPPGAGTAPRRQRIAKLMARAGLCSRRDAEAWVVEGRVNVNGTVLTSPATDVSPDDTILVDGAPLPAAEKTRLFLFHKPRGLVTSDHDPEGRATVADYLRDHWPDGPRTITIGRLDINTEGLLLLTNDGGLARTLELPQTGWVRRYRVRANGEADPGKLEALADGLTLDGVTYAGIEARLDRAQGANCWLTMGLREGKNREIKRVLEHLGLEVNRLIRLSFGPFQLLDLPEGAVEEVRTRVLREQLGDKLAAQAGAQFDEPAQSPASARGPAGKSGPQRPAPSDDRPRERGRPALRGMPPRGGTRGSSPRAPSDDRSERPRRGAGRDAAPDAAPPKRERPVAGTRKHVSRLRAAETETARTGPRRRTIRSDTQDRRDRKVQVERLVSAGPGGIERNRLKGRSDGPPRRERTGERPREFQPEARPDRSRRAEPQHDRTRHDRIRQDRPRQDRPGQDRPREDRPRQDRPRQDRPRQDKSGQDRPQHVSPSARGKRARMARSGGAARHIEGPRTAEASRGTKDKRRGAPARTARSETRPRASERPSAEAPRGVKKGARPRSTESKRQPVGSSPNNRERRPDLARPRPPSRNGGKRGDAGSRPSSSSGRPRRGPTPRGPSKPKR